MRERKYIKFRVDMYDGTKFKIIDRRPERDLIHYVWNRVVFLAGKVNLEGELYLSKNIPYTIETLSIEFNRDSHQVKLALELLIELEMIELNEHKIYKVKNFAKHQNIKGKEKSKLKDIENEVNNQEVQVNENPKNQINHNTNKQFKNKISKNKTEGITKNNGNNLEITNKDISKANENIVYEKKYSDIQDKPIISEKKKNKKANNKKIEHLIDVTDKKVEDNIIGWFSDGEVEIHLGEGEGIVNQWSF